MTPTSYLELLSTFNKLLGEERAKVSGARKRLEAGLDKLTSTAAQVRALAVTQVLAARRSLQLQQADVDMLCVCDARQVEEMQRELQQLQPVLAATAKEVEDMMLVIAHDKEEAAATQAMVQQQEREANAQAATAKAIAGAHRALPCTGAAASACTRKQR